MDEKDAPKDPRHRNAKSPDWDQEDVLEGKDHTTRSGRGLQLWGDETGGDEARGDAGEGTAARSARLARGQAERDEQAD